MRKNSQDAVREFRPYFDNAPVYGHGPSLEDFTAQTPLTVGSPQQVIDRTLGFRDYVGDYQRQLFLMDHAGLPLKTVLEQLDILGEEVVPVLRKEFAALSRPTCRTRRPTRRSWRGRRGARRDRVRGRRRRHRASPDESRTRHRGASDDHPPLAVISAGLTEPSSTRLLADRLAEATVARTARPATTPRSRSSSCATSRTTSPTTCSPASRRPRCRRALDAVVGRRRRSIAVDADLHAPPTAGCSSRSSTSCDRTRCAGKPVLLGATGGTARHSLALDHALRPLFAYLRARRRADRRLRGVRGLGERRGGAPRCADRASGRGLRPGRRGVPGSTTRGSLRGRDAVRVAAG